MPCASIARYFSTPFVLSVFFLCFLSRIALLFLFLNIFFIISRVEMRKRFSSWKKNQAQTCLRIVHTFQRTKVFFVWFQQSARACWIHCYPCLCTCVFVCFCIRLYEKMWTFFEYEIKNNNEFESLEQIPCRLFFIRLNFAFYFIYIFHFLFQVVLFILFLELKFVFHHIREVSISIFIFCFFFVQTIFSLLWHCVSQLDYSNEKKLSCISLFKCHSIFFSSHEQTFLHSKAAVLLLRFFYCIA